MEKMREYDAAYNADCEEVERLKKLLEEDWMDTLSQPPRSGTSSRNTNV